MLNVYIRLHMSVLFDYTNFSLLHGIAVRKNKNSRCPSVRKRRIQERIFKRRAESERADERERENSREGLWEGWAEALVDIG